MIENEELYAKYRALPIKELNRRFLIACRKGDLDGVIYVLTSNDLPKHANIHVNDDEPFRVACEYGHLDIVKFLTTSTKLEEHSNIHAYMDNGFIQAMKNGNLDIVEFLIYECKIEQTDPIKYAILNKPNNLVIKMFENRTINEELTQDLKINKNSSSHHKIKI